VLILPFIAFFVLLIAGVWMGDLSIKQALIFVGVWAIGIVVFSQLGWPRGFFVGVEVVLDIILVLKIFGSDIRIN